MQVVVEKSLMKERKLTRHDLGRENFMTEVHMCLSLSFTSFLTVQGLLHTFHFHFIA